MENIYSVANVQYTPFGQTEDTYYNTLDHVNSSTALVNDNIGVYSTVANNKEQEPHPQDDTTTTTTTSPNVPDCTSTTTREMYGAIVRKDGEKITVHVQSPSLSTHPQNDTTTTNSPSVPDVTNTTTGEIYSTIVKKNGEKVTVHIQTPPLSTNSQSDTTATPYLPDCTTTTTGETYSTIVRKDGEKVTIQVQPPSLSKESTSDEMTPTSTEGDTIQQEPTYDQPIKKQPPQKPQRPDIF